MIGLEHGSSIRNPQSDTLPFMVSPVEEASDLGVSDDPSPVAAAFGVRYPPQAHLGSIRTAKAVAKDLDEDEILRTGATEGQLKDARP